MRDVEQIHHEAMHLADQADAARRAGDDTSAQSLITKAFELEAYAARMAARTADFEPTTSILFRSAVSLGVECGKSEEARHLIAEALSGDPPAFVIEELGELTAVLARDSKHAVDLFTCAEIVLRGRASDHLKRATLIKREEARDAVFNPWDQVPVSSAVRRDLSQDFPMLYRHQAEAITAALGGHNIVVPTRTASGKSLIYLAVLAQELAQRPDSTALLCYPQRALAHDQAVKLRRHLPQLRNRPQKAQPGRLVSLYDGQTDRQVERRLIREEGQIILTNPEMVHLSVLPFHETHWSRFLSKLRYVVLDEAHDYRGTFGTNLAMLIRRLELVCRRHGSRPQFIATSATIADPRGHLEKLTGSEFRVIGADRDGSKQGPKQFWIAEPSKHPFDLARALTKEFVDQGRSVLTFCQSRQAAERLAYDVGRAQQARDRIVVYRAGLSAEHRREIEDGLRSGAVKGVFSTSALELGIDIPNLDVCICVGLPNTMMSLWQRAGRVGRGGAPGLVILIPEERPIDLYYTAHPERLLTREVEPLAINLQSRTLATWHYACALYEAKKDLDLLTPSLLVEPLATIAEEHRNGRDDSLYHSSDVHKAYNIRAGGDGSFNLLFDGRIIGDINRSQLLRETAPNAIYFHGAEPFRVQSVREFKREISLIKEFSGNRTESFVKADVRLRQCWRVGKNHVLEIEEGRLLVTQRLVSMVERARDGGQIAIYNGDQGLQPYVLPTTGVVVSLERAHGLTGVRNWRESINGLIPLLTGVLPAVLGPCDLGDFSVNGQIDSGSAKIFIYDQAYDGIRLTTQLFGQLEKLLKTALERVTECSCQTDEGCFNCVRSPTDAVPTTREGTALTLRACLESIALHGLRTTVEASDQGLMAPESNAVVCAVCQHRNPIGNKFCGNCGTKLQ